MNKLCVIEKYLKMRKYDNPVVLALAESVVVYVNKRLFIFNFNTSASKIVRKIDIALLNRTIL